MTDWYDSMPVQPHSLSLELTDSDTCRIGYMHIWPGQQLQRLTVQVVQCDN